MKVMSFSPDVRTIIWFASAVSLAVSEAVKIETISQVTARCGENVSLTCDATLTDKLNSTSLGQTWQIKNKSVCQRSDGQPDSKVLCNTMDRPPVYRLTLTLLNVMPGDQGEYFCKLQCNLGIKSSKTLVEVQNCIESSGNSINESHAECWFSGVYPNGTVHWFREGVNLTDPAGTREKRDDLGRYNVSSTIDVQRGNRSHPYICSLWIPSAGMQLSSQRLYFPEKPFIDTESSGSMVKLQWICIMVEIMMVKLMT